MASIISIIPIVLLFVLMLGFKMAGHKSALLTLVVTVLLALFVASPLGMIAPAHAEDSIIALTGWALVEGLLKAVFPILIIILMAIYSYNILVESKQIEVIKKQFTSITDDKGLLVLMLVWGFGGLLEGMAGFGTAVAIPAAILIGLGFKPMFSALVSLIGNTVATGFGAVGVPVTTLCNEVAEGGSASVAQICETSAFAIIQLAPLFIILPFIILTLTDKHNLVKNLIIALWVGVISVVVQFVCGYYLGSETPAIIGSLAAIIAIIAYAKVFARKASNGSLEGGADALAGDCKSPERLTDTKANFSLSESFKAWSVYLFILIFILVSGALCPPVNAFLKSHLVSEVHLPVLDSTFKFGWISNAGLMLFLGATIGGLIQGLSFKRLMVILARTTVNLRKTVVTICSLIALASVMNYCGMITAIASGLVAVTGDFYPLVAPMIGAIGTFVTGSDTSSNILFAKLQAHVANQLGMTGQGTFFGMEGSQSNWLVAANTTGATGGKMISPQSIAIATAACDMEGKDGDILKSAIPYAVMYIVLGGLMVYFGC
nr:lactate permease LctP family transporter [uncultured Prevotella sp.]